MNRVYLHQLAVIVSLVFYLSGIAAGQGIVLPTDTSQLDILKAYRFVFSQSNSDYRFTNSTLDTVLFPRWGECSVYWIRSGPEKGGFVFSDVLPPEYASLNALPYSGYDWKSRQHSAIAYKAYSNSIAVFRSGIRQNNTTVSWEAVYFRNLLQSYLLPNSTVYIDEKEIDTNGIAWSTQLLIVPAFAQQGTNARFYVDSIFNAHPSIKQRLISFLNRGGTIYTEGNAVYLAELLGVLPQGAVDYSNAVSSDPGSGNVMVDVLPSSHPVSFSAEGTASIHANSVPAINAPSAEIIATLHGTTNPVVFSITGNRAMGGRIVCNTALPAVGGSNGIQNGTATGEARQLLWTLNAALYAFTTNIDVTRSVYNEVPDSLNAGKNAVSFDRRDTLEVRILVRNLSANEVHDIQIAESIRDFYTFVGVVTPGETWDYDKPWLTFSGISLPAFSEKTIVYRIATPDPTDPVHEKVGDYISWSSYMYASYNITSYSDDEGAVSYRKYRDYTDLMFSARMVADTDCNWKNFLGLYYQPFKVFTMMENKERTPAMNTTYVQYIPKDVPFYWTDDSLNIPILKTPGGKYVDILKGSNDQNAPEFDMDSDGHPDAWLDTASIFPKGYLLEETSVYWLNPWEHLRSGNAFLYEDIDHDGVRAQDTDGDGIVDIEEPGDKIRVWKLTWNMGKVSGYQYFDPYCSYELWVDPPDLVPMSAGVGEAYGKLNQDVNGMFYPYSPDVHAANLADTSWTHWMQRDKSGFVTWSQLVYQSIHNYEGFTFIDTAAVGYNLRGTDRCAGTVPQPHREFIAVLSLGGEEIDMHNVAPEKSQYSNLEYTTVFGEKRNYPIRTTYTFYAPLPNPLQFEYITNNFFITDSTGLNTLTALPAYGKANLTFEIDVSTEYTYYWIRNVGHDVDFNDPSLAQENEQMLGDGVFGYMMYDIPKGMGGYRISLPQKDDGSYDIDRIVKIDGKPFSPWLTNPHTANEVQILEDQFAYHVYIPQLLIPPALDDDNNDGIDDWIDDRGDRFCAATGFFHDIFMLGNGEQYPDYPADPFRDDIYGMVTKGWYSGADETYGDDFFETLGKTHITISAQFQGSGREGSVAISKGGWLVVEEIFGGSPWVLFSHALNAHSEGMNISLTSSVTPTVARFGADTVYLKHVIEDKGEPHYFDINFDPYTVSYGHGKAALTTTAGGKDPCNFVSPSVVWSSIVDPSTDHRTITLMPDADGSNPDLAGYPKQLEGTFLEVRIEASNGSDYNWVKTNITPVISESLGATRLVMSYVSYPRPLVPAQADPVTGAVTHAGDNPGTFQTGWRFNQPEGEMLVNMGNEINLMQPSRRAYFVFLFSIDETLRPGIYDIDFKLSGDMRSYNGDFADEVAYDVPPCKFSIVRKNAAGNASEYQKMVLGQGGLTTIGTRMNQPEMTGLERVRWSATNVGESDFDTLRNSLPASFDWATGIETVDLSPLGIFPTPAMTKVYVLEQSAVLSRTSNETMKVTQDEQLEFVYPPVGTSTAHDKALSIATVGPKLELTKRLLSVNGQPYSEDAVPTFDALSPKMIEVEFEISNQGASMAEDAGLRIHPGSYFAPVVAAFPANCRFEDGVIRVDCGSLVPGESRSVALPFTALDNACAPLYDSSALVNSMTAVFSGVYALSGRFYKDEFTLPDPETLELPAYDFHPSELSTSRPKAMPGKLLTLSAVVMSGEADAHNVTVGFYAVVNQRDTILLGSQVIGEILRGASAAASIDFTVPATAQSIEFLVRTDPNGAFGEFCEFNNTAAITVPLCTPSWILELNNYPNPVSKQTVFSYTLPQRIHGLTLTVHSIDGKILEASVSADGEIGRHSVAWQNISLPPGTYIYTFTGRDDEGTELRYSDKLVVVK